jgi:hypothetical protein
MDSDKNISDFDRKVHIITSQTNYSQKEAEQKLREYNNNYIHVIKEYLGLPIVKSNSINKSVHQEIYKQIRYKLDATMRDYNEKNPINIDLVINNLTEEENRKITNQTI